MRFTRTTAPLRGKGTTPFEMVYWAAVDLKER